MTKCNHNPMFNVETLAACLDKVGVKNEIVEGAILVDTTALAAVKKYEMPQFLFMNYEWLMKCAKEG